jgi:predicted  nucleic acid-binding Zn-ribbon protein|tara:strand:+ start:8294 stop:8554 length:261 start_codon:yes stop_codon:yes gene_type:complete
MSTEVELVSLIQELKSTLERMSEKQDEMNADIRQIKEAVYNPDSGLYARLRALEQWKESYSKITWAVISSVIVLVTATIYQMLITV